MAKSIRSKRMRKLRNEKRIRYGEKELARLKEMLGKAAAEEKCNLSNLPENNISTSNTSLASMQVDSEIHETVEETKTSKYPCWLSHFKIRRLAKQERKQKKKEMKRLKKEKKASHKSKSNKSKKSK